MFRPQSSDHHQGSITVLVQLLLNGVHASSYSGMWLYVCASVHTMYLFAWCLVMYCQYITRHHADRYIVCTDAQTYSHIQEYDEACTPINSNCTSTVIDP